MEQEFHMGADGELFLYLNFPRYIALNVRSKLR